ncbi:MAG TPA: glutathione S-transferase [Stellaceae bacterium]|nr:glutathione S-transferase [Stellaceae bacterium]
MITLFTANTPNGQRAAVALEEFGLPYRLNKVDIFAGGAKTPEFLKINPNARIPVIIDPEGPDGRPITVPQSWAILLYLAEKTGTFIPADKRKRLEVMTWLFHVAADVMMVHSTLNALGTQMPEKTPPAIIGEYEGRVVDALRNLDRRFSESAYLIDEPSIADFGLYPIFNRRRTLLDKHPELVHLARWGRQMDARPGCRRGVEATQ